MGVIRLTALGDAHASAVALAARMPQLELCPPSSPSDLLLITDALALDALPRVLAALPRIELTEGNAPPRSWHQPDAAAPRADAYVATPAQLEAAVRRVAQVVANLEQGPPRLVYIGQRWADWLDPRPLFDEILIEGAVVAGRANTAKLQIVSDAVARNHTRFSWDPAAHAVAVEDLGTTNSTNVDGKRYSMGRVLARARQEVAIGINTRFRVAFGPRGDARAGR